VYLAKNQSSQTIALRILITSDFDGVLGQCIDFTSDILHVVGVRALYKGLGPTLVRTFPATGALFLAVETTKKFVGGAADEFGFV